MAEVFFSQVGSAIGSSLLPNGVAALGLQVSGAAIGQAVGSYVGSTIDNALFGPELEGRRLDALRVTESREGVSLPLAFGRVRLPGQVIWSSHFTETAKERSVGGKGGPEITEYSYTASFAVALCEGEITRVSRAWANGAPLALGTVNHRIYRGTEGQLPDPAIEAVEGSGTVPGYRGTAYIVFEDLDLTPFGNRLPQLSFEVIRVPPSGQVPQLADVVRSVNLIPASGEFVYATERVRRRWFPGIEQAENMNNTSGVADMLASLDQLEAELPLCRSVSMVTGWFGTGATAGDCAVRPGVERLEKTTRPWSWRAGGVGRGGAHLISRDASDRPVYGGTPDDRSVVQGIREMVGRGLAVTLTPFLFMDTPGLPWRGRLVTSAHDRTAAVRSEIATFVGTCRPDDFSFRDDGWSISYVGPAEWSYRRFILHHAWLAKRAGGVKAFLIGSEMVGMTRLRDETGAFPFVESLVQLAADVKSILGNAVEISYAADWTEYGAYVPSDGSGDVLFPLDPLWASSDIDYVGIDWYAPMGDWRDGEDHLDRLQGFSGPSDPSYLVSQIEGGEGYDWFYGSEADRAAQLRSPIIDTAHGEDWIFRVKDIRNWRSNFHHERPAGVRNDQPTSWLPGSKPVRFCEVGFPAVNRGTNQPNVFFDPKSNESALPHHSAGGRDDSLQRAALAAIYDYWDNEGVVDELAVWAWDARPFPDFPGRLDVWSDGANWSVGHWLNGRAGTVTLGELVDDLARQSGIRTAHEGLSMAVPGYTISGPTTLRRAIEPLVQSFGVTSSEDEAGVRFSSRRQTVSRSIQRSDWAVDDAGLSLSVSDSMIDKGPDGLRIDFIDGDNDFAPGHVDVSGVDGQVQQLRRVTLPMTLNAAAARELATAWLSSMTDATQTATLSLSPAFSDLVPGQAVTLEGNEAPFWIESVEVGDDVAVTLRRGGDRDASDLVSAPVAGIPAEVPLSAPDLNLLDLPGQSQPMLAGFAEPWPGRIAAKAGASADDLTVRASLVRPARTGRLLQPLRSGPIGRWDGANVIEVETGSEWPVSVGEASVLNGANQIAIETAPDGGAWEVLSFAAAEMIGARHYRLSGLLRGLGGSDGRSVDEIETGARVVAIGSELVAADIRDDERGLVRIWRAGDTELTLSFDSLGTLPWKPAHLRVGWNGIGLTLNWIPRGADIPGGLDEGDPARAGVSYQVTLESSSGAVMDAETPVPAMTLSFAELGSFEPLLCRVSERGGDGRLGPAASAPVPPTPFASATP